MEIVYILTNAAFPSYIKIGKTKDLKARMKQLDTSGVPLPFECYYAVEVKDSAKIEKLLHEAFVIKELGYDWTKISGPAFWQYNGKGLYDLRLEQDV